MSPGGAKPERRRIEVTEIGVRRRLKEKFNSEYGPFDSGLADFNR